MGLWAGCRADASSGAKAANLDRMQILPEKKGKFSHGESEATNQC
jgi:hypothetical protein